jgi:hypothetical protein
LVSAAVLALFGVAGCAASEASNSGPAPTSLPAVSSADEKAIVATYEKYMAAYVHAYDTGDADYAAFVSLGGGNGAGLQQSLRNSFDAGVIATGEPKLSKPQVRYVDTTKNVASVTFCFDASSWRAVDATSLAQTTPPLSTTDHPPHPAYFGDAGGSYTALMLLDRDTNGSWTVQQTNAQPDRPC